MQRSNLYHTKDGRNRRRSVQHQLADIHFRHGEVRELRLRDENEEQDQRDYRKHQHENANEESLVRAGTVNGIMMRRPLVGVQLTSDFVLFLFGSAYVAPHDIQNGCADQRVLNGAREQER